MIWNKKTVYILENDQKQKNSLHTGQCSETLNCLHTGQCSHKPVDRSEAEGPLADLEEGWQRIQASQPTGKEMLIKLG